ncbi:hypothetical protein J2X48_001654 [Bosea sp. BE271]|uniref:hypothetical protein n=1 Tax=Bosea TaxID=85413 RepID=UPI002863933B|nr:MULTISPECIES: hypothetical protein [Bosea]MDR6827928.1 hypothetical protein [Bosea robiniae]MDR6894378.1 hypothetical protein [Bosea sp. BE109]MDR7138034.1 hypothetical protein [Bosea sp. BE168]MDR7174733.1 hypothetical protein [Bosea sp. BE271]
MDDLERQPPVSEPLSAKEKGGDKALGLLLMGGITVTMAAWIVFLGWAAWSILGVD